VHDVAIEELTEEDIDVHPQPRNRTERCNDSFIVGPSCVVLQLMAFSYSFCCLAQTWRDLEWLSYRVIQETAVCVEVSC
jgi:hypothetical protein